MQKDWQILAESSKKEVEEIIQILLENRGLKTQKEKTGFLEPIRINRDPTVLSKLFDSEQLKKALKLIQAAIKTKQPIIIHGDYDVDGICATAILWETIYYGLNYQNVTPFIPHRVDHGYGLSRSSIDEIKAFLTSQPQVSLPLLITCDCGITGFEEVDYAKNLGFVVIITDHHALPESDLPQADTVLHTYELCGAGIAFALSQTLLNSPALPACSDTAVSGRPVTGYSSLELVTLATIGDLQPLLGLNRSLVKDGLPLLTRTRRPGLKALYQEAGILGRELGPYEVSWMVAPRLNAMGRLEHALESLRLLCTRSFAQAQILAQELGRVNRERQKMTEQALVEAKGLTQSSMTEISSLVVLASENWHEGIIGLIAGKISEEFYRPTIVIAKGEKFSKASARSINGIDIIQMIRKLEHLLVNVGGHAQAAGFTIETEKIKEFSQQLTKDSQNLFNQKDLKPVLRIDLELGLNEINWQLWEALQQLAPYGIGNPRPTFATQAVEIADLRTVGQEGKHLKIKVKSQKSKVKSGEILDCIGFNLGQWVEKLKVGDKIDIVYTIDKDTFSGGQILQFKLKDLRKS